jgi:hypothetical protein
MNKIKRALSDKLNPVTTNYWVMVRKYGLRKDQTQPNHTRLVPFVKGARMIANRRRNPISGLFEKVQPNYFAIPIGGY